MEYDFVVIQDVWHYETREEEFYAQGPNIEFHISWQQITGAGSVRRRVVPAWREISWLPGWKQKLAESGAVGQVMVASERLVYFPIERTGPMHDLFIADLALRLGDKWHGESLNDVQLRKQLGYATWWVCPLTILFTLVMAALLLTALGAFAFVVSFFEDHFWVVAIVVFAAVVGNWIKKIKQ